MNRENTVFWVHVIGLVSGSVMFGWWFVVPAVCLTFHWSPRFFGLRIGENE